MDAGGGWEELTEVLREIVAGPNFVWALTWKFVSSVTGAAVAPNFRGHAADWTFLVDMSRGMQKCHPRYEAGNGAGGGSELRLAWWCEAYAC